MKNVLYLRERLEQAGFGVIGNPSAIVSAQFHDEALARMVSQRLPSLGVVANLVEYPAVAKGSPRFRLQVMARHTRENIDELMQRLLEAHEDAKAAYAPIRAALTAKEPETVVPARRIA
jgi:glycine C-acetyltransferase